MQNLQKKKKQFLPTNSCMTTSILGVSGLELHSSGTNPVNLFGAQSLLGGEQFLFGGAEAVILGGTAPESSTMAPSMSRCDDCAKGVRPQHRKIVKTCKCEFCE